MIKMATRLVLLSIYAKLQLFSQSISEFQVVVLATVIVVTSNNCHSYGFSNSVSISIRPSRTRWRSSHGSSSDAGEM